MDKKKLVLYVLLDVIILFSNTKMIIVCFPDLFDIFINHFHQFFAFN